MLPHQRRTLTAMEFSAAGGVRLILDADGWRLVNPRQLGQTQLTAAESLRERAEVCLPPRAEDDPEPTLVEIGEHAAKTLGLRITHRHFRQGR
jgi:hypothetical protein